MQHQSVALLLTLCLLGCSGAQSTGGGPMVAVTQAAAAASRRDELTILDVRTPEEFGAGHVRGAINIDVNDAAFREQVAALERDRTYLVHCSANIENGRSARAIETMQRLGFSSLESLEGGYAAWVEAELPVTP